MVFVSLCDALLTTLAPEKQHQGHHQRPPIPLEVCEAFSFSNSGTRGSPPALESQTCFSLCSTTVPIEFPVYSSSRPKLKPCSSWENFLGRVKGQSPDSMPFTLYILATALISVRVISYLTILPPFHMESSLITGSTVSGTYFVPEKYLPS